MKNKHLYTLLTIAVIFVFITSLFSTVNVLADDGIPPTPTEEPVVTEVPVATEEPVATEVPVVTEVPLPTEILGDDISVPEALAQLPRGTDVIVLDENGETLPLVSTEAAEVLTAPDPYFTVGLTTYRFFGVTGDCSAYTLGVDCFISAGDTPIQDAVDFLSANDYTPNDGNIYVEAGSYAESVTVDGSNWTTTPTSLGIFGAGSGSTNLIGYFEITDMNAFTLSGFNVVDGGSGGYVYAHNNTGTLTLNDIITMNSSGSGPGSGDGIYIYNHVGDINLTNVYSHDNVENGLYADNVDGSVLISNSEFSGNFANGLNITAGGSITLQNVIANGNDDNGAILDSCGCIAAGIFISSSTFDYNGWDSGSGEGRGLIAHSYDDITLVNVNASFNAGGGAELDNDYLGSGTGSISVTGTNIFQSNGTNLTPSVGLYAFSYGDIILNGVFANGNGVGFGGGAYVESGDGDISIANSDFSGNCLYCAGGFGLAVLGYGGDITLNNVTANNNGNDPYYGYTGTALGLGAVIFNNYGNTTITNSNFNNNCTLGDCIGVGLGIISYGNVYLDHVSASGNGATIGVGTFIFTNDDVDIYCSTFSNNAGLGLVADIPPGSVMTLNGVVFGGNTYVDFIPSIDGSTVINPFDCDSKGAKKDLPSLPLNIVNVTSGQSVELDCEHFSGTRLMLENGNSITLPCPINDSASILDNNKIEDLPKPLPEGNTFLSAFTTSVSKNGEKLGKLGNFATISFVIPEGADVSKLAILFWNGTEWTEVKNTYVRNDPITGESYFEAYVNDIGTFVLVQQ